MYRNYDKNKNNISSSNDVFNKSGQNIITNKKNLDIILNENKRLRIEINKKNKEIEQAQKRLNILEKEIQNAKRQNNNNKYNKINSNRGKSVGIRKTTSNINNNFFGGQIGMFGDSDPFNDSFFKFPDNNQRKSDDSFLAEQMEFGFI